MTPPRLSLRLSFVTHSPSTGNEEHSCESLSYRVKRDFSRPELPRSFRCLILIAAHFTNIRAKLDRSTSCSAVVNPLDRDVSRIRSVSTRSRFCSSRDLSPPLSRVIAAALSREPGSTTRRFRRDRRHRTAREGARRLDAAFTALRDPPPTPHRAFNPYPPSLYRCGPTTTTTTTTSSTPLPSTLSPLTIELSATSRPRPLPPPSLVCTGASSDDVLRLRVRGTTNCTVRDIILKYR